MKKSLCRGILIPLLLLYTGMVNAQNDSISEIRHYNYSSDITGAANQLYRIAIACQSGRLATWKDILITDTRPAMAIALIPSGSNLAVANDRLEIEIWSLEKRNIRLGRLKGHTAAVKTLDYSPDARYLLSAGLDKTIRIWDIKNFSLYKNLPCQKPVNTACFSPNGNLLAYDQGNNIVIFNYNKNTAVQSLNDGHKQSILKISFSDDGKYLVSCDKSGEVIVWRVADGEIWRRLSIPGGIKDADIHHNNKYLATIDQAGKLKLWNLKKEELLQTRNSQKAGRTVQFSYDYAKEQALLTHSDQRNCYLWDIVRLEPAFDLLAAGMQEERMSRWNRKRANETSEAYGQRVNDSLQLKNASVRSEVLTELGTRWRPLGKPERSEYAPEQQSYTVTIPGILPFTLKIEPGECRDFEECFSRCELRNPIYTLNERDEFGLSYLEIKDPVKDRIYYLDEQNRHIEPRKEIVSGEIVKKIGEEEVVLRQKLKDYFDQEMAQQRISDNVKVNVEARPQEGIGEKGQPVIDYHIAYSYEVLKTDKKNIGDWAPGRYLLAESNAATATVQVIRETFEKELAGYITPDKNITIKITGSADGSPILNPIKYTGLYGDFEEDPYYLNGNMDNISISTKTGIGSNNQLAYLRTYGVRHFLENEIPALKNTDNAFEHRVFISEERGNEFRRVSIELIIHNAFAQ